MSKQQAAVDRLMFAADEMVREWVAEWGEHDPHPSCPCCEVASALSVLIEILGAGDEDGA